TAFRLEALDDSALPGHGPGTAFNGNFVLTEFKVRAAVGKQPDRPVKLHRASADFSQTDFPVANAIDGKNNTGWAILPATGKAHTAVFEPAAPVGGEGETTLTVVLDHQSSLHPRFN